MAIWLSLPKSLTRLRCMSGQRLDDWVPFFTYYDDPARLATTPIAGRGICGRRRYLLGMKGGPRMAISYLKTITGGAQGKR